MALSSFKILCSSFAIFHGTFHPPCLVLEALLIFCVVLEALLILCVVLEALLIYCVVLEAQLMFFGIRSTANLLCGIRSTANLLCGIRSTAYLLCGIRSTANLLCCTYCIRSTANLLRGLVLPFFCPVSSLEALPTSCVVVGCTFHPSVYNLFKRDSPTQLSNSRDSQLMG